MKLTTFLPLLSFLGIGLAAPRVHQANFDAALSRVFTRDSNTDCNECRGHRDNCLKYAVGDNNSGCAKVCTSYVCRKWDCSRCGDEFNCKDANLTMPPGWN